MSDTKDWRRICADCREGKPPKDCEYYGEPRGCNAPTYGGPPPRYYEELREGNARLRAALKVAEDALRKLQERLVASVHDGTIDPHEALEIAEDAIATIRDEGARNEDT